MKSAKSKKTKKIKKIEDFHQINLKNIRLSKESRKSLRKIKEPIYGNVCNAIECGDWYVPSTTYEFVDIKTDFEKSMYDFFNIPSDAIVEIDYFDTGILCFEKGIYPKWHK